jgi:CubicO group peptidase (beta-lactamase class C family)
MDDRLVPALASAERWGADHVALAVIDRDGIVASHGDLDRAFAWASVTKLVTALAVHVAVDGGRMAYDDPAGPPGSAVRHLLAHASGLPFEGQQVLARPGERRIYSNPGYDELGSRLAAAYGRPAGHVLEGLVLEPLGMTGAVLTGRPSEGLRGSLRDLVALARELATPTLIEPATHAAMTTVAFPGLVGVVPGVGRFDPCDWGLGPELRDGKTPHWTGDANTAATFGHFGGTGTFLWMDPARSVSLACLTDRPFGTWALEAWPTLADAVIEAVDTR